MYFLEDIARFFTRILLIALLCGIGYADQKGHMGAKTPADTAERFDSFKRAVEAGINIKPLMHKDSDYTNDTISQQEAQKIVQAARDKVMAIIKPYTQDIMVPRSTNDSTQISYRVIDFKKLAELTPDQVKALFEANASHDFAGSSDFGSIAHKYPDLLQAALGDIAAQLVMFDGEARSQLSQLLINWFTTVSKEISELLELIKDKNAFDGPRGLIDAIEKIRAKARQYEHNAAPYLALWSIIVQGIFSENKYTLLFNELPNSDAIRAAYDSALQALNVKQALEKLLKSPFMQGPFVDQELANRLLTNDLAVWAVVGILFTPDKFEKAFVEEPLKQEEESRKQREAEWKKREAELEPAKKAYEAAQEKFKKIMANNPEIMESDFFEVFRFGTLTPLDEDAINKRIVERKAWLAKHPEALREDFDNSIRMYWILRGLNEEPNNENEETVLPKFIQARKNWVQKYPGAVPEDFYDLHHWEDPGLLENYLTKRKPWLAQNPGKKPSDYLDVWRELEKADKRSTSYQL
jgi:hypothetical protein